MYQRLVTQFSNTLSQVLLLASTGEFAEQIQTEFEQRGFSVHFLDLANFLNNDELQLELQKQSFYKIVTLFGWTEKPLDYQLLTQILQARHEPTLIISRLDTFPHFSPQEQVRLQQAYQRQTSAIAHFADNLPKKTLLIGQDIISTTSCHLNLRYICRQQDLGRLTDPEIDFAPLPSNQFLAQNLAVIFSPYDGKRFLFCAEPIKSEKIVFRLSELSGVTTQIISHPYEANKIKFSFRPTYLFGKTDLRFFTPDFFNQLLNQLDFEKVVLPKQNNFSSGLKKSLSQTVNNSVSDLSFPSKNINGAFRGANLNEEFFQEFTQQIASQEEKILHHYHSQAPYQHISLKVPSCNLLRGKPVCSLVEKKDLRIPPIVEISCFHQDDLFFPPATPPFTSSRQLKTSVGKNTTEKNPLSTKPKKQPETKSIKPQKIVKPAKLEKKLVVKNKNQLSLNKSLFLSPAFLLTVFALFTAFYIFVLPQNHLTANQKNIYSFFSSCQKKQICFSQKNFSSLAQKFQPNKNTAKLNDFVTSLTTSLQQKQLLETQINRLYRTLIQKESGDMVQEINLVDQTLNTTLGSLNHTETQLNNAQNNLQTFIPLNNLSQFKEEITAYKNKLLLWQKYKNFFLALAQQENLNLALLLLDNTHLLNQGGQFLATQDLIFAKGQFVNNDFSSTSQLLNKQTAKSIKIDNPKIFQDSAATAAAGLYNAPYQEKFADFYNLFEKTITPTASEPDLVMSFNFNSYAQLAASATGQETSEIFSQIETQLSSLTLLERENFTLKLHQNLGQILTDLKSQDQAVSLLFTFLEQLNQQEMLFASRQPAIKDLIESANLNHQLNSRSCPSALGGSTCYIDSFVQLRSFLSGESLVPLQINHLVALNPQETVHARTLTYQNASSTSSSETITFILPEQTIDVNFSINGEIQLPNLDGSYSVAIPSQERLTAVLTYVIPRSLEQNNFVYSFAEQKQSGAYNQKVAVSFKNNLPYSPKVIAPSATIDGKKITFVSGQETNFLGAVAF